MEFFAALRSALKCTVVASVLFVCTAVSALADQRTYQLDQKFVSSTDRVTLCYKLIQSVVLPSDGCDPQADEFSHPIPSQDGKIFVEDACEGAQVNASVTQDRYLFAIHPLNVGSDRYKHKSEVILDCRTSDPSFAGRVVGKFTTQPQITAFNSRPLSVLEATELQKRLKSLGFYKGRVDGVFGRRTRRAIKGHLESEGFEIPPSLNTLYVLELVRYAESRDQGVITVSNGGTAASNVEAALANIKLSFLRLQAYDFLFCRQEIHRGVNCSFDLETERELAEARVLLGNALKILEQSPPSPAIAGSVNISVSKQPPITVPRCEILQSSFGRGTVQVIVKVDQWAMIFRNIAAPSDKEIIIGVTQESADALYSFELAQTRNSFANHLNRSVPQVFRKIDDFMLQTTLIEQGLFNAVTKTSVSDVLEIAPNQANGFVKSLNDICAGVARFRLPREEELEHAMRLALYPRGLSDLTKEALPCKEALRSQDALARGFLDLAGAVWQITSSTCARYDRQRSPQTTCEGTVIKGGTSGLRDELGTQIMSCLPQFRDSVDPGFARPLTSFRLVLETL